MNRDGSDDLFHVTLASIGDAVIATDSIGRVTFLNPVAEELTGWSSCDAQGQSLTSIFRIINEYTREPVENPVEKVLRLGQIVGLANHTVLIAKDGGERPIDDSAAPIRHRDGHVVGVVLVFRDVTQRRRLEAERQRFVTLAETSNDFVGMCDMGGVPFFINEAGLQTVGLDSLEHAQQTPVEEFFFPEDRRMIVHEFFPRVLRDGKAEVEVRFRHFKTGEPLWMTYAVFVLQDEAGQPVGLATVSRNIGEQKRVEVEMAERNRLTALRADLSTALAATQPLQPSLLGCCEALVQHLDMAFARIWTHDQAAGVLQLQASAGMYTHLDGPHSCIEFGQFKIGRIAANRTPHLTNDVPHDPNVSDQLWARREGMVAFAGYPLVVDDQVVGVMAMFARRPLSDTILTDLAPLTDQVAQHIHRKRGEDALRKSEQRYRLVGQAANDAIWDWDLVADQVTWSEGIWRVFRYAEADIDPDGSWWIDHIHPEDQGRVAEGIHRVIDGGGECWTDEYRFQRADGSYADILDRGRVLREEGRPVRMVGSMLDLTERKRAERAVRGRSEQLRRLADAATRIAAAHDVPSVLGVVTEEVRLLIGCHLAVTTLTSDHRAGQSVGSMSMSEEYAQSKGYRFEVDELGVNAEVIRSNRSVRLTQRELELHPEWSQSGQRADSYPSMRGYLAAPLAGRDGRNIGLVQLSAKHDGDFDGDDEAVLLQLAQNASVAVENARLYEELQEANRRKDEFLATLAHELRNPLAPIRTGLELLKMTPGDAAMVDEVRTTMEGQTQHLVRLVDDLLDVSRITSGKVTLRRTAVELRGAVGSAVEATRAAIDQARHKLVVSIPPQAIYLDADSTRLTQILTNLLTNAARYTPDGGRITLTAEPQGDGQLRLIVKDTGIGLAANMLDRIFDMFTQADSSLEKPHGGLGIGLTLVKRLVEMHGGSIEAHSDGPGSGSEFVLQLPMSGGPNTEDGGVPAEAATAAAKLRVLVVDDNKDAANLLSMMVQMMGNLTSIAHDGEEAVQVAADFRPDVVLMDIGMPKMNGYDAARLMREQPWGQRVVLVALTGWGQDDDRKRTREAGFDRHLVKPVEPSELQGVLAAVQ